MAGESYWRPPGRDNALVVRVQLIDPAGDVAPYDHALAAALAARGAEVELITSRFVHGPAAAPDGYTVDPLFHRLATRYAADAPRRRRALRLAEHVPDMLRLAPARDADIRHFQWLPAPGARRAPASPGRPRVLTLHNVLRAERLDRRAARRHGRARGAHASGRRALARDHGVPAERVRTIPHGAFEHLTRQAGEAPLPEELRAVEGPVVLCFGVVREYKGVDVLLEAFREVDGAELWVVGRPLGESMERLRRLAPPGRVRFVPRYVSDRELPAYFRRADLLVLPHRRVDVSGVLFAGLAFGKAMVLSDVGGFRDVAEEHGAGPAGAARGPRGARRRDPRAARRPGGPRGARAARARRRGGALLVGPHRRPDDRALRGARGMRVVFMAKSKRSAARALAWLVDAGLRGGGRGGLRARRVDAGRAACGPRGRRARAAAAERGRALRGRRAAASWATWTWWCRSCSGTASASR